MADLCDPDPRNSGPVSNIASPLRAQVGRLKTGTPPRLDGVRERVIALRLLHRIQVFALHVLGTAELFKEHIAKTRVRFVDANGEHQLKASGVREDIIPER